MRYIISKEITAHITGNSIKIIEDDGIDREQVYLSKEDLIKILEIVNNNESTAKGDK